MKTSTKTTKQDKREEVKKTPAKAEKVEKTELDAKAICALGPKYGLNIEAKTSRIAIRKDGQRIGKIEGNRGVCTRDDEGVALARINHKDHVTHLESMSDVKAFLRGLSEIEVAVKEKPKASAKPKHEAKEKKNSRFVDDDDQPRRSKLSRVERRKLRRLKKERQVGRVHSEVDLNPKGHKLPRRK